MPAREYGEWLVYSMQHPSQVELLDWHFSVLCSLIHSVNRGKGRVVPPEEWSLVRKMRHKTQVELDAEESERVKREFGVM